MKLGNFTGIAGIPNQDIAMWETMGRTGISDRTKERLGASDIAVVEFRRLMIDAARRMRDTGVAIGRTTPHIPACQDQLVRGHRAEDDRLAHARRRPRGARAAGR